MTEALSSLLIAVAPVIAALVPHVTLRRDCRLKRVSELVREHQQLVAQPSNTYAGELRRQIGDRIRKHVLALHAPFTPATVGFAFGIAYPVAVLVMSMTFADFSRILWAWVGVGTASYLFSAVLSFKRAKKSRQELQANLRASDYPSA